MTVAVSEVVLPGVVGLVASAVAPHITLEPLTKSIPVTVSARVALPAAIELGLSDVIVGPLTTNALVEEIAVLELCTVIFCEPAEASWALVTRAVSEVAVPGLVGSGVSGVAPQYTVEPPTKFVPVTPSEKGALPAEAEVGVSDVIVGPTMVTAEAEDLAPPGLCTDRLSVPRPATRWAGMLATMTPLLQVTGNAVAPE